MSIDLDGKIANQSLRYVFNSGNPVPVCGKCGRTISKPSITSLSLESNQVLIVYSYIETSHFIYPTKSGKAVTYCSKHCRNKHNHRFQGSRK